MYRSSRYHVTMFVTARHIERDDFWKLHRMFTWCRLEINLVIDVVIYPFGTL
jgi:hypothetical protein